MFFYLSHTERVHLHSVSISNLSKQQFLNIIYENPKKQKDQFDFSNSNFFSQRSYLYRSVVNKISKVLKVETQKREICEIFSTKIISKTNWKPRFLILTYKKLMCISISNKLKFSLGLNELEDVFSDNHKNKSFVLRIITTKVQENLLIAFTNKKKRDSMVDEIKKAMKKYK
jgi:uncharacterized protein YaaW (UPF0174 family)